MPAGNGRAAGAGELYDALLDGLYAQSDWPQLGDALAADATGDGAQVVAMSDHYNANGSTNGADAGVAIDCLDHPASHDLAAYGYLAGVFKASAPVFGPLLAWGEAACAVWPAPPTRTVGPVSATGAPPILVIGTTDDPATPYAWAVSVTHELSRSVLLTVDGDDHVVVLLQRVRARRRADLSRRRHHAARRRHVQRVGRTGTVARSPLSLASTFAQRVLDASLRSPAPTTEAHDAKHDF